MNEQAANSWDDRFAGNDYVYGTEANGFLRSVADGMPPAGKVLCLAEGEGRNAVFLAGRGHTVTAVDASAVGLKKAMRLAEMQGVAIRTVHADLAAFAMGHGAWDAVVSIFAHVPEELRRAVHRRVVDALRPGGVFVLEAYTPAQLALGTGGPRDASLMMNLASLREELAGLTMEIGREVQRVVTEGSAHSGEAAVVQVLARKPL